MGGNFECVKLLVARGVPQEPLAIAITCGFDVDEEHAGPDQLRCLQYILDTGGSIHTTMLMWVATSGNLDFVRLLHSRGVALWAGAYEEVAYEDGQHVPGEFLVPQENVMREQEVIAIPALREHARHMESVLQYGWAMGSPVTPAMEEVLKAKRAATRATLLCFGVASRRSREKGTSPRQRAACALMAPVPVELVEKMVILAEFEIPETLHRALPRERSVKVEFADPPHVAWMRNADVPVEGFVEWENAGCLMW
jgi:hypothetical protein